MKGLRLLGCIVLVAVLTNLATIAGMNWGEEPPSIRGSKVLIVYDEPIPNAKFKDLQKQWRVDVVPLQQLEKRLNEIYVAEYSGIIEIIWSGPIP